MELKLKKRKADPNKLVISIAVNQEVRQKSDWLKGTFNLDLNEAIRSYISDLYEKAKAGEINLIS